MADLTWIVNNHRLQITSTNKAVWTEPYTKLRVIAGSDLVGGVDQWADSTDLLRRAALGRRIGSSLYDECIKE